MVPELGVESTKLSLGVGCAGAGEGGEGMTRSAVSCLGITTGGFFSAVSPATGSSQGNMLVSLPGTSGRTSRFAGIAASHGSWGVPPASGLSASGLVRAELVSEWLPVAKPGREGSALIESGRETALRAREGCGGRVVSAGGIWRGAGGKLAEGRSGGSGLGGLERSGAAAGGFDLMAGTRGKLGMLPSSSEVAGGGGPGRGISPKVGSVAKRSGAGRGGGFCGGLVSAGGIGMAWGFGVADPGTASGGRVVS